MCISVNKEESDEIIAPFCCSCFNCKTEQYDNRNCNCNKKVCV